VYDRHPALFGFRAAIWLTRKANLFKIYYNRPHRKTILFFYIHHYLKPFYQVNFMPITPLRKKLYIPFVLILLAVAQLISIAQSRADHGAKIDQRPTENAAKSSSAPTTHILLDLADLVGERAPAELMLAYQRRSDPSGIPRYWAIVDFDQPSTKKRLYIFDTQDKRVDTYYVAHGRGSEGTRDDGIAELFSNEDGSNSSSLGIYKGLDEYVGAHGRSMRLAGLEQTNSNALARSIVLHRADYVSEGFIRQTGRLGRSEGCFAVETSVADTLIDKLKNGGYIIAWKK
jgi:L,D-transpeptidase catalytic domain